MQTRQHPAEEFPYPDHCFDLVTCRVAAHHFSSPEKFIRETARVLSPGGISTATVALHDVRLVYEALAERQRLRKNAPHLVKVLPFLLPVFTRDGLLPRRLARLLGTTMWAYDLTGGARIGNGHYGIHR